MTSLALVGFTSQQLDAEEIPAHRIVELFNETHGLAEQPRCVNAQAREAEYLPVSGEYLAQEFNMWGAAIVLRSNKQSIIMYDADLFERLPETVQLFMLRHECQHDLLGHSATLQRAYKTGDREVIEQAAFEADIEADCHAFVEMSNLGQAEKSSFHLIREYSMAIEQLATKTTDVMRVRMDRLRSCLEDRGISVE